MAETRRSSIRTSRRAWVGWPITLCAAISELVILHSSADARLAADSRS
jgi:hypothetical protein